MLNLEGRVAAVFGLANKRSIAWGIAQKLHEAGAKLAISYQNERMKAEAEGLILDLPGAEPFQCDVSNDAEIEQVFAQMKERYGKLDVLVHCIAYRSAGGSEERLPADHAGRIPHRPRRQRLFADRAQPRRPLR